MILRFCPIVKFYSSSYDYCLSVNNERDPGGGRILSVSSSASESEVTGGKKRDPDAVARIGALAANPRKKETPFTVSSNPVI
jgi:hypothetical protein